MWTNRSGGQRCRPWAVDRPLDEAGVVAAVRRAAVRGLRVRPAGGGFSDAPLVVTDDVLVDTSALTGIVHVGDGRVRVRAGATLRELLDVLAAHDLGLDVLPGPLDATVAGLVSTGAHGGGPSTGSLSSLVTSVLLVDGLADVRRVGGPDLDAVRTSLGALGVITELELAVVPLRRHRVQARLAPLDELLAGGVLDAPGRPELDVWAHGRAAARRSVPESFDDGGDGDATATEPIGVTAAAVGVAAESMRTAAAGSAHVLEHVVPRFTPTLRRTSVRWASTSADLPHRLPSMGRRGEVTEWALPRAALEEALRSLTAAGAELGIGAREPVRVRVGAAETGWLHPAHGRATAWVAVGLPVGADPGPVLDVAGRVLGGLGGRPHWATRHGWTRDEIARAYPRLADFTAVRDHLDPGRVFASPALDALLGA